MISLASAQVPRNSVSSEGKSSYGNIAVTGLNATGLPGYIEMRDSSDETWYLYLDDNHILKVVSAVNIGSSLTSPRTTDWTNFGEIIGLQNGPQSSDPIRP